MPELSAIETAQQLAQPVGDVGGRWMLHADTLGPCRDAGYKNGFVYYVVGRGGVLGDCDADVVTSAFGFFEPALVRTMWEGGIGVEGPRQSALRYGAACAEFGRSRLGGFAGAQRLCELAEATVDAVDVSGLTLFAGWRREPRPADPAGRAYFLIHLLREWRGSAHVVAVAASGLSPLQTLLTSSGGAANAKLFGWGEQSLDVSHLMATRAEAERLTEAQCVGVLETALSAGERAELVQLVGQMKAELDRN